MRRRIIHCILFEIGLLMQAVTLYAQTEQSDNSNRYSSHGLTFGFGITNVFDSYLSPLEYSGQELRIQKETIRQTTLSSGNIFVQNLLTAHVSHSENTSGNGNMYEGLISWNLNYLYKLHGSNRLQFLIGPSFGLNGGAIYNKRNSNNPAQAKVSADIAASAMALYKFHLLKKDFVLRYQLSLPLLGAMFSPEYGESYYEIFELKHSGKHVCLTNPVNAPSLRQQLTLDFTVKNNQIRIGYSGDILQSNVNQIKSHVWSHAIMIGFVKNFQLVKLSDSDFRNMHF